MILNGLNVSSFTSSAMVFWTHINFARNFLFLYFASACHLWPSKDRNRKKTKWYRSFFRSRGSSAFVDGQKWTGWKWKDLNVFLIAGHDARAPPSKRLSCYFRRISWRSHIESVNIRWLITFNCSIKFLKEVLVSLGHISSLLM